MTRIEAAVYRPASRSMAIEELRLEPPREGEVQVKLAACGICHTDVVLREASVIRDPVVLGHEGAGVVEALGPGVTGFEIGDRVLLSFASCGACHACEEHAPAYCDRFFPLNYLAMRADGSSSLSRDGEVVRSHFFGQSSFATHAVCSARNLVKIETDIPLELSAPFGCGFQTGAGAIVNALRVPEGASVMVMGAGAVGLSAVMAARNVGAAAIIAADLKDDRLALAAELGATTVIRGDAPDFEEQLRAVCPAGVDYIVDTSGHVPAVERAVPLLAVRGTLALVASYPGGSRMSFDMNTVMTVGRKLVGVVEGDSDIEHFIPLLLDWYRQGKFPVEKLVRYYDFKDINQAIADAESGRAIKPVVRMP